MKKGKNGARGETVSLALLENQCDIIEIRSACEGKDLINLLSSSIKKYHLPTLAETSLNEKIAYEVALTASISSKRASVILDRNGLAFAMDSLMSSVYTGVLGGFLILVFDEAGPPIGGIQDSRTIGMFAKLPVFDPSSCEEVREMIGEGFVLSEKFQIPVMVRLHSQLTYKKERPQPVPLQPWKREGLFIKNSQRWAATPRFRYLLHLELNKKLKEITGFFENQGESSSVLPKKISQPNLGIISCGANYPLIGSVLSEMGLGEQIPVLKVSTPHPLPKKRVEGFVSDFNQTLIFENALPTIEIQLDYRKKVMGKLNGAIPFKGEFTRKDISFILSSAMMSCGLTPAKPVSQGKKPKTPEKMKPLLGREISPYRPLTDRLRRAFPKAMVTGDRNAFGLALGLDRFHSALDTSSSINLASGLYHALHQDGETSRIIAITEGDAFFHSGISALVNAVYNMAKFILLILGGKGKKEEIEKIVYGCCIPNCEVISHRNTDLLLKKVKQAFERIEKKEEGIVVFVLD
ncbi:MAG: hypothetical protein AB1502_07365 [Thermodesulfobacteriota bacterium]